MKKVLASLLILVTGTQLSWAQSTNLVRPASIGFSFSLNDFATAQKIRSTSLSQVFRDKSWSSPREQDPGLALTFFKGLHKNIDFAGTLGVAFVTNAIPNKAFSTNQKLMLSTDASFNFKMLPDNFWFSPYLIAGVGASKIGDHYGAFLPLGGGVKINLFDEAAVQITHQYRVPLTNETLNHHFFTSLGIVTPLFGN